MNDIQHAGRTGRERGQASLEVVSIVGLVTIVMALSLQLFSAIYAGQAAGRAAWDAARAHSLGHSAASAAQASLPGNVKLVSVTPLGDGVRITVRAHEPIPWISIPEITREAYVP